MSTDSTVMLYHGGLVGSRWWVHRACCLVYHPPPAARRHWTGVVSTRTRTRGTSWPVATRPGQTRTCCRPRTPVLASAWLSTAGPPARTRQPRSEPVASGRRWRSVRICVNWRKNWRRRTRCPCFRRHVPCCSAAASWHPLPPTKVREWLLKFKHWILRILQIFKKYTNFHEF